MIKEIAPNLFPTLNQYGLMTTKFDWYTEMFIQHACSLKVGAHVAEIGAAYGAVTEKLCVLNHDILITVNDLETRHLEILSEKIGIKNNVNMIVGRIPNEVNFGNNSFNAILAARVLQYLNPEDFMETLRKFHCWLQPNGKIYIICKTPYIKLLESFITEYETKKSQGIVWPGIIHNLDSYNKDMAVKHIIPKFIHVFDPEILARACIETGFVVEHCSFLNRSDFPNDIALSGKEEVGIIAVKQ